MNQNEAQNIFSQVLTGPDSDGKMAVKVDVTSLTADTVKIDQSTPGTSNGVSIAEIGATTVATGNGVAGAGTQRVAIASDNTPFAVKIDQTTPGTTNKVAIDQTTPGTTNAVSLSQINATTTAVGNGVVGNGVQRVAIASDNSAIPVTLPTGTETPSASVVTGSGSSPVTAGKLSVTFTTDSSFVGTILGVARNASTTYAFSVSNPGKTLAAIAYTVTAGSMIIDVTV
jgi:hypothetical protein